MEKLNWRSVTGMFEAERLKQAEEELDKQKEEKNE